MKAVVWLDNPIRAFALQAAQLAELRRKYPAHAFEIVHDQAAFLEQLGEAELALVWRFEAAWYALAPALQLVATPAAGREPVQPDPSGRVRVLRGRFHGKIMAESLLAMILFHTRRLAVCVANQRDARYARDVFSSTRRLSGQRALIVGYGPLGRECARLLKAVGMHVTAVKRDASVEPAPADALFPVQQLPHLLPRADHLILILPGDTGTQHLISDAQLELLPETAALYNIGRGNALDEAALLRALNSGRLASAFLDVFEHEPLPADSPLWATPNLTIMPHASAISSEYLDLWLDELAAELQGNGAAAR